MQSFHEDIEWDRRTLERSQTNAVIVAKLFHTVAIFSSIFITLVTFISFFSNVYCVLLLSVSSLMSYKIVLRIESLVTLAALVRFVSGVSLMMY